MSDLPDRSYRRSVICRRCQHVEWHYARGLCLGCYSHARHRGELEQYPRRTRVRAKIDDRATIVRTCYGIDGTWMPAGTRVRVVGKR